MELIDKLNLSDNLIAFGARPGMGLTRLTLKLANRLARKENVLFITYQDYYKHIEELVNENGQKQNNLVIDSSFKFFNYGVFDDLKLQLLQNEISTLVVDNLNDSIREKHVDDEYLTDYIISELHILSQSLKIRIIINLLVSKTVECRGGDLRPQLRDFRWSRRLINDCQQIYSIYRPAYYGITENENGEPAVNSIGIQCLKGATRSDRITLDNRVEKILPLN